MSPKCDTARLRSAAMVIASKPAEGFRIIQEIGELLESHRCTEKIIFHIKLALEEAIINAIKHGNQMDPHKQVHICYELWQARFDVVVTDEGPGFDPGDLPDPTDPENLDRPCGRGLLLMRSFMTEVTYNGNGNSVRMSKVILAADQKPGESSPPAGPR